MKRNHLLPILCLILAGCAPVSAQAGGLTSTAAPEAGSVPNFDHIVLIVLENRDYRSVIGGGKMPHLESLARQNVLLSSYSAVSHPSLPNYIALMSGSTQGITQDCTHCFVHAQNLADLLDASHHTWKAYEEDMPSPCFVGDAPPYYQKHDPFIYFDSVRLDAARCNRSIVPLTVLDSDLTANQLPNFSFIMPNICNSGHSCPAETADTWVYNMVNKLQASPALGKNSLIIITFDEASGHNDASCCGSAGGGQVATVLISPLARPNFVDNTPYTHFDLLQTILSAWHLPELGQSQPGSTKPILAPWNTATKSP